MAERERYIVRRDKKVLLDDFCLCIKNIKYIRGRIGDVFIPRCNIVVVFGPPEAGDEDMKSRYPNFFRRDLNPYRVGYMDERDKLVEEIYDVLAEKNSKKAQKDSDVRTPEEE